MSLRRAPWPTLLVLTTLALPLGSLGTLAVAAAARAPSGKVTLKGRRGGALMRATPGAGAKTFNPLVARETSSREIIALLFDGLVTRDLQTLAIVPALAQSWNASADGRTWTFRLRDGLHWSDGRPLTADDVIFTFNLVFDPKVETTVREILTIDGKPLGYAKVDDRTVRFTLPTPFGPFLDVIGVSILPRHKLEAAWKAGKFNSAWGVDTPPAELVGTGPFKLARYAAGEKALYTRNPYYWRRGPDNRSLPFADNQVTQFVADQNAMLLKFRGGELDGMNIRAEDWAAVQKGRPMGGYRTANLGPAWGVSYISFNLNPRATRVPAYKRDWFKKKEFRQAVSYALDRNSMVSTVFRGLARPLWSPVSEANKLFYNPKVRKYPHDPAKAKALLKSIGFADKNGDGILEDGAGHELGFVLLTAVASNQGVAIASIIQDDLKKVGIKVTVSPVEFNSIVTRIDSTYDWECVQLGFTGGPEPHGGKSIWTSPGHLHNWNPRQAKPATPWEAEIDQIFSKAAKLTDHAKRKALYDRWQAIAAEQLPLIFLVTPDSLVAVRNRVQNARPSAMSLGLFWNAEELAVQ